MVTRGSRWPLMIDPQGQVSVTLDPQRHRCLLMNGSLPADQPMSGREHENLAGISRNGVDH